MARAVKVLPAALRALCALCALCAAAMVAAPAVRAAGPASPFTPPPAVQRAAAAMAPAAAAAASSPEATASAAAPTFTLEGVRVGVAARALIDGRWVALGEQVHGATLVAVDTRGALLRRAGGQIERLGLLAPSVSLQRPPLLSSEARLTRDAKP